MNFYKYFLPEHRIFLDNISYETVNPEAHMQHTGQLRLGCKDTIVAQLAKGGIKITFNRALCFDPKGIFTLSVTFGAFLFFNPQTRDEIDWKNTDIAGEFRKSGGPVLTALMTRTALMVGQITAASGQNPIITPSTPKEAEEKGIQ